LGYVADKYLIHKYALREMRSYGIVFTVPFLLGISIPLANLKATGAFKVLKVLLGGLLSLSLFWFGIWFVVVAGTGWEFFAYLISGINSVVLLRIYSLLLDTVKPSR